MNERIKKQLEKCRVQLPPYTDSTTYFIIPGNSQVKTAQTNVEASKKYIIEIKDYIIHEPETFTLSSNWNHGTKPPEYIMSVKYVDSRGKMIMVEGTGVTTNVYWKGWLPQKGFEVQEEQTV